ncbi:uncharacterized protein NEMAJ01_2376 [Nematocida major]|uniref:uncharacterized protein n=1 Tax=Nematocida major TaxID=1912982 RepID=UPI0020072522|nr:uncharacterized protein NEMAJ01_2376 [Nematocida major]KAH9387480.1 hypothetical protein NEMAJ01_2376 [Nematocida major]
MSKTPEEPGDCGCFNEEDACKEKYLEAYRCYIENRSNVKACLSQIQAVKACYARKQEKSWMHRLWAFII